ncbi:hypothetical protein [Streptomyces goshikiensis]
MQKQLTEQAPAVTALAALVETFGHLPAPYIVVHTALTAVEIQLNTPQEFEAWRSALGVAPAVVTLHAYSGATWLAAETRFRGVALKLSGHGLNVTAEQVVGSGSAAVAA